MEARRWAMLLSTLAAVTGCESDFENARRVKTFNEAGRVLISLAPPQDFRDKSSKALDSTGKKEVQLAQALKPRFNLTMEQALKEAIPTTTFSETMILTALLAKLGVSPATTNIKGEAADAPDAPDPKITPAKIDDSKKPQLRTAPDKPPLPVDPLYKHAVATALYQQARLADAAIDGVIRENGDKALLAPLSIDVLPYARGQPYDVYLSIRFTVRTENKKPLRVIVLPLLVADNVEGVQTARTVELLIQLQLVLKAMSGGTGILFDSALTRQKVQSALGTDLNSLLTVGRMTNNTLSVRIGAQRSASSTYATVPRNTTVWTLLLVSERDEHGRSPGTPAATGYWDVEAVSHTTLRDAEIGAPLPTPKINDDEQLRRIVDRTAHTSTCRDAMLSDGANVTWHERLRKIRRHVASQDEWRTELPDGCVKSRSATNAELIDGEEFMRQALPLALLETLGDSDYSTSNQRFWWSSPPRR